jgi:hypothetical protein
MELKNFSEHNGSKAQLLKTRNLTRHQGNAMSKPKKPSIKVIEPDPWENKANLKKRIKPVQEDDPIGT